MTLALAILAATGWCGFGIALGYAVRFQRERDSAQRVLDSTVLRAMRRYGKENPLALQWLDHGPRLRSIPGGKQ